MKRIYLDHAAATPLDPVVKAAMEPYCTEKYGNPGSSHSSGQEVEEAVDDARSKIASLLQCSPEEIVFTSGGTESINLALQGIARASTGKHIITSVIEHPAVLETCKYLETQGYDITYVDVDEQGIVDVEQVKNAIREDTVLISLMYANNELGAIQPISEIGKIAKEKNIPFHSDACQAGLLDLTVNNLGVDLLTLNGSKVYGPKGVGLLYVRKGTSLQPLVFGGGQEQGLRSGSENVPGIVGMATALELMQSNKKEQQHELETLRDELITGLLKIQDTRLNGHPTKRLSHNVNISFAAVEGESLVMHLNEQGICASTGSACTSKKLKASHVLQAINVPQEYIHGSIRFSLGNSTSQEDIQHVLLKTKEIIGILRKVSPLQA